MFRFFRQIRQTLLSENKYVKYAYYVIGEITLVVIGILIAFQIDNWNEDRIIQNRMAKIYKTIKFDLINDLKTAKMVDSVYSARSATCDSISKYGLTREEFMEDPYFYFSLPLRSHTVMISPKGYESLMRNIDYVPDNLDTLVSMLNQLHVNTQRMNSKYDFRLDNFTWELMDRWAKEQPWFYTLKNKGVPTEDAINYFTTGFEYKNILEEYEDYLFNASIPVDGILNHAPKCLELIEKME